MSISKFLQREKFPMCCGATILCGFGWTNGEQRKGEPSKQAISKFLRQSVDLSTLNKDGDIDHWHDMTKNAFHMAILSDSQKGALHHLFIDAGFEVVSSHSNHHSFSNNHLYVRKVVKG